MLDHVLEKISSDKIKDLEYTCTCTFFNTPIFKDGKRSKTQTSAPKQTPFLDQRSLPKVHGLQPALVAQALYHLLLAVLTGVLNKQVHLLLFNYNVNWMIY